MTTDQNESFLTLNQAMGRTLYRGDEECLFFGGTAYLGLNTHPEMIRLYTEGLKRYGLNIGTSRNNNVQLDIYSKAEKYLSERFDHQDAVVVSSGFLASQLALRSLTNDTEVYYAPGAHPALWPTEVSPSGSVSFEEWAIQTIDRINHKKHRQAVVVSDSFASIMPFCYDFSPFVAIEEDVEVCFLLDDSHGFGVFQNPSINDLRAQNRPNFHFVQAGSLAKGIGIDAGVVLGSMEIIARFRQSPIFSGASPPSPAAMYTLVNSSAIYEKQQKKLQERMGWFERGIQRDCQYIPGFPVYCFADSSLYEGLLEHSIVISSFSYPRPCDPLLNRVVINSMHTKEDIERLLEGLHM